MAANSLPWANPELRAKVLEFQSAHQIVLSFFNFEIFDMVRYRQPDIMGFVDALISSQMIFHRRWGDSAIKFLFASMFWHRDEVYQLCDFDYQHSSWTPLIMCDHRRYEDSIMVLLNHTRIHGSNAYIN
jgi:hypothetical protein